MVAPYLTLLPEDAGQREHSLREVFNGLRYVVQALKITATYAARESAFVRPRNPQLALRRPCSEPAASSDPVGRYRHIFAAAGRSRVTSA